MKTRIAGALLLAVGMSLPAMKVTAQSPSKPTPAPTAQPAQATAKAKAPKTPDTGKLTLEAQVELDAARVALERQIELVEAKLAELEVEQEASRDRPSAAARERQKRQLQQQLNELRQQVQTQARVRTRTVPSFVFRDGLFHLAEGEAVTSEVMRQRQELFLSLDRVINLELRDATIRQAAEAMSQASGIPINVDPAVQTDQRLTVMAQAAALKTVLAEVARQMGLLISPDNKDPKAVLLRPMSSLEVNGKRTTFRAPNAPWSSAWGPLPTLSSVAALAAGAQPPNPRAIAELVSGSLAAVRPPAGAVSMTGMGNDMFVVAHPAPGGEAGVILTVYRLEGSQLRVVSTTTHRMDQPGGATPSPRAAPAPRNR